MTATQILQNAVDAIPYWYHRIELPGGITTPGWAPTAHDAYPEVDFADKRVLDVGAWDGYWTFDALSRGARQVLAVDDFSDVSTDMSNGVEGAQRNWESFDVCREAFGYTREQCQRVEFSVYNIKPESFGKFDIVLFYGVLYHCRHPLLALDNLSAICRECICVESAICNDYSPYRGGLNHGYPDKSMMLAEFYPGAEYARNQNNWWAPTLNCLGGMLHAAGFPNVKLWKLVDEPNEVGLCRGFAKGVK